jgi:hypothetical protein
MRTDRPVVIDDDEPDSTDDEDEDEDEATRGGVDPSSAEQDANPYSALLTQDTDPELSKPNVPSCPEQRYDVEAGSYVDEDLRPFPPLEQESLASTLAQGQPHSHYHSPRPSYGWINQHDDGNTQRTSEEPGPLTLPKPLDVDGGGEWGKRLWTCKGYATSFRRARKVVVGYCS